MNREDMLAEYFRPVSDRKQRKSLTKGGIIKPKVTDRQTSCNSGSPGCTRSVLKDSNMQESFTVLSK